MTHFAEAKDYLEYSQRIITGVAWSVPLIELRNGRWLVQARKGSMSRAAVPRGGLLKRFCGLRNAKPPRIEAFARRYGLLYLCAEHGLPQWHSEKCGARTFDRRKFEQCDDIDDWRMWAHRFGSTIELTRAILNRCPPESEDVEAVFLGRGLGPLSEIADLLRRPKWLDLPVYEFLLDGTERRSVPPEWEPQDFDVQLGYVVTLLKWLLQVAHVARSVVQPSGRHALAIVDGYSMAAPLFGALTFELAAACADVNTLARCQNCERGFKPSRVSAAYCPKCRDPRVRWRRAQQRRRESNRARGLSARGMPLKKSCQ
jgi:hypothetical protein